MHDTPSDVEERLHSGLSRIRDAVGRGAAGRAVAVDGADAAAERGERATAVAAQGPGQREDVRRRARQARWARKARRARPTAIVFGVVAVVSLYVSLVRPDLWWLVFAAFGAGAVAAWQLVLLVGSWVSGAGASDEPAAAGVGAAGEQASAAGDPGDDPRVPKVRALCAELLASIESGPAVVRQVVQRPKATLEGLRDAFIETTRRERELRAALRAGDESQLRVDREALERRVASEADPVARERFAEALRALDEQLGHRAELATAATRLEAESTRILYTLEGLRLQLLRARSSVEEESSSDRGLRETLESLSLEIDAVAEALEGAPAATPPHAEAARRALART